MLLSSAKADEHKAISIENATANDKRFGTFHLDPAEQTSVNRQVHLRHVFGGSTVNQDCVNVRCTKCFNIGIIVNRPDPSARGRADSPKASQEFLRF